MFSYIKNVANHKMKFATRGQEVSRDKYIEAMFSQIYILE